MRHQFWGGGSVKCGATSPLAFLPRSSRLGEVVSGRILMKSHKVLEYQAESWLFAFRWEISEKDWCKNHFKIVSVRAISTGISKHRNNHARKTRNETRRRRIRSVDYMERDRQKGHGLLYKQTQQTITERWQMQA